VIWVVVMVVMVVVMVVVVMTHGPQHPGDAIPVISVRQVPMPRVAMMMVVVMVRNGTGPRRILRQDEAGRSGTPLGVGLL
jgi:hypothetical protein